MKDGGNNLDLSMVSFEDLCNEIGRRVDAYAVVVYRNDNRKKLADQYQMWT